MKTKNKIFTLVFLLFSLLLTLSTLNIGQAKANEKVIIYSNADEEVIEAMKHALNKNGYREQYIIQTLGTAQLAGKMQSEGKKTEADIVTLSSHYLPTQQKLMNLYQPLKLEVKGLRKTPNYYSPLTVQQGTMFYNTKALKKAGLKVPKSLADLAKPEYFNQISIADIKHSSTTWLLFQALIEQYGETKAKPIIKQIYKNANNHLESSGSAPLKKVQVGEVAIGFGLTHQAKNAKASGYPVEIIIPTEGIYNLTESIALVNKPNAKPQAQDMINIILKDARKEIIHNYPAALYQGEKVEKLPYRLKTYKQDLTLDLLNKHIELTE